MLHKDTFHTDAELNGFFESHKGIYIVKFIIVNNSTTRRVEYHLIYSTETRMSGGQHLKKGLAKNV